jgi:L-glutamine---4-(methylsulfanyl)-2-oxobutanoate aminotransferase
MGGNGIPAGTSTNVKSKVASMRPRPDRLQRLPQQYFAALLARVAEAAARHGERVVDLGRGNPETPPPPHVIEALVEAAHDPAVHGYAPFSGLPALKEAIAERYATVYGVPIDPEREVAILPGTKTTLVEAALVLAERGSTVVLPDPGYPDYHSGVAFAAAHLGTVRLDPDADFAPEFGSAPRNDVAALYLNYPSNPCAAAAPPGAFAEAVRYAEETGAAVVHDFAYGDLVFGGRRPESFLAVPGAREVGIELFSMSKSYGMAGWRLGFAVGNAEMVSRLELVNDHVRVGIFAAIQRAGIAALRGPQEAVEERRATYERRRDYVVARLAETRARAVRSDSTFYVWVQLPDDVTPDSILAGHLVAVAPGEGFGGEGAGWARLSLAVTDERLQAGLERLVSALE